MKYVIKNCDNYTELDKDWTCRSTIQNRKGCYSCKGCTDCVLKKIVEYCKSENEFYNNKVYKKDVELGRAIAASNVLQHLDIEECK